MGFSIKYVALGDTIMKIDAKRGTQIYLRLTESTLENYTVAQ